MLDDKNALITGATRGLGAEIAHVFVSMGANVMLCARDEAALESVVAELWKERIYPTQRILACSTDISQPVQVDQLFDYVGKEFKYLDILVNNAGIQGPIGPMEKTDWGMWKNAVEVDLLGTAYLIYKALPLMKQRKFGKIINLSGGGAAGPRANYSAYSTAKAGLVRLTVTIAQETADYGIDINAVAPGAMSGKMLEETLAAGENAVGQVEYAKALKRKEEGGASPKAAARLCAYLASEKSNGITGRLISAVWDDWEHLDSQLDQIRGSDLYTLRRIVP